MVAVYKQHESTTALQNLLRYTCTILFIFLLTTHSKALCVAEQKSRDAVDLRSKLQAEIRTQADKKHESLLRKIASDVKSESETELK